MKYLLIAIASVVVLVGCKTNSEDTEKTRQRGYYNEGPNDRHNSGVGHRIHTD